MSPSPTESSQRMLMISALLRWFDRELLSALAGAGAIDALLAGGQLEASPQRPGAYRLRGELQAAALVRLRAEHPHEELTWHRHFFDHFLSQIGEIGPGQSGAAAEQEALYHLGQLFLLIAARQEWHTLEELVAAARAAGPRHAPTSDWLDFYAGFAAIRTQRYAPGTAALQALIDKPDLPQDLRLQALNSLGQAAYFQSDYDRALGHYTQVLDLARALGDLAYQGYALGNLSNVYEGLGRYEQALGLHLQILPIFRAQRDEYREAKALYHLGYYAMQLGRWQAARGYLGDAIALYERLDAPSSLAYPLWGVGLLQHMLGDEPASEAAYLRARAIAAAQQHGQPELALDIHFQLGFLYQTQGRCAEALEAYAQAAELAARLRDQYSAAFISYRIGNVHAQLGQLGAAQRAYQAAIEGVEALRGAAEREEIKLGLLGNAQQVYEAMVLLCLELGQAEQAFDYVERARSRAFLDQLSKKRAAGPPERADADAAADLRAALDQPVATLAELQAELPADALLIEYFTTGVLPRGESLINQLPAANARLRAHLAHPPRVLIFAVTRDRLELHQPAIDPATLRPQLGDPVPVRRLLRDSLLVRLYDQLIAPAASLLAGRRTLYLIPHGPLHYVPFMALRSAGSGHLLDPAGPAIALAPSATILLRSCLGRRARPAAAGMYALGYNAAGDAALRYAEAEARYVARLAGGQAWVGPAPKIARLIEAGPRARYLHIAGHAVYDPRDALGSALRLGADEALSAREIIARLDLGAELVTLSACLSGMTEVVPGDELLGLQRAFLYAGAPAVVCALWEAADLVALLVMERFYTGLWAGAPPAAALRDAQAAVRGMTGRGLADTIARWRADQPELFASIGEPPDIPPALLGERIYADPIHWAPFMLIGRAGS